MVETRKRGRTDKEDKESLKKPRIQRRKSAPKNTENLSVETNTAKSEGKQKPERHSFTNLTNVVDVPPLEVVEKENNLDFGSTEIDTEDEKDGQCSMERKMEQNIRDNAEFFARLGIHSAKAEMEEARVKYKPSLRGVTASKKSVTEVLPRRQSLRIQNRDPEGGELPEKLPSLNTWEENELRKEGPLNMKEVLRNTDLQEAHGKFWGELSSLTSKEAIKENRKKVDSDLKRFLKDADKMQLNEFRVAKVVPNRVFSVAIHPTESKVLVVAGDKWGKIGFWDVNSRGAHDGVFCYEPHTRPVKQLRFQSDQPDKLYSCSYDGLLRCCYFETGQFDQLYSTPEEDDVILTSYDFLSPTSLIVSQGDGCVAMVDTRSGGEKAVQRAQVSLKPVRSVSIHPLNTHHVATASADCTVKIWDLRQLKKKPEALHTLPHSKTVECAFFSPLTGKHLLSTANDDKLRLYDTSNIAKGVNISHAIRHNNHTGRWLSKFRATWHPAREDIFICGSMARPRQIELFDATGSILKTFQNEDYLNSVCSLNAFHPTRHIIAGGNSSGRLHIFM